MREQGLDGGVPDPHLAERGEHRRDVVEEGAVGADDEHARAIEPLAEGVEQPRGPVESHRGLAGAGRPLDADADSDVAAHDLVLLGLDRRDDVAHRSRAGSLDLRREEGARGVRRFAAGGSEKVLVLERRQPAAVDPEAAAQDDVHPVERGRAVEGGRDGGPPVDDDRVAGLVGDVPPPDVELLRRAARRLDVDPPEEEGRARIVLERGDAAREHPAQDLAGDGVARPRRIELLGRRAHPGQLGPGPVEVGLLALEIAGRRSGRGHGESPLTASTGRGSRPRYRGQAPGPTPTILRSG